MVTLHINRFKAAIVIRERYVVIVLKIQFYIDVRLLRQTITAPFSTRETVCFFFYHFRVDRKRIE